MSAKQKIFYSRIHRRLKTNKLSTLLYFLIFIIPSLGLFIVNIPTITQFISALTEHVLVSYFPDAAIEIVTSNIPVLGAVSYIDLPTVHPSVGLIVVNIVVMIVLLIFTLTGSRQAGMTTIFFAVSILLHLINCLYFFIAGDNFPYSAFQYSELYMIQQVGIWGTFIVITGLITGFFGGIGLRYKMLTFFGIVVYSFVFGAVRYMLFLYILERFSIIYMAPMFFVFGPLIDLLYLVGIYALFVNKMVQLYDSDIGKGEWLWS